MSRIELETKDLGVILLARMIGKPEEPVLWLEVNAPVTPLCVTATDARRLAMLILEGLGEKLEKPVTFADINRALLERTLAITDHGIAMLEEKPARTPAAPPPPAPAVPANVRLAVNCDAAQCLIVRSTLHNRADLGLMCRGCKRGACVVETNEDGVWRTTLTGMVREMMIEGPPIARTAEWTARLARRINAFWQGIDSLVLTPELDEFPMGCQVVPASEDDARAIDVPPGRVMVVVAHDGDRLGVELGGRTSFYSRLRFSRRA